MPLKKISSQNMRFCQNIPTSFSTSFFKISTLFTFPDIESDWCVVRSRFFYWRKDQKLNRLPRYFERFRKAYKKVSRGTRKKVSAQKMKNEARNQLKIFWQNLIFWAESFFSNDSRKFSLEFTNMFGVSERST